VLLIDFKATLSNNENRRETLKLEAAVIPNPYKASVRIGARWRSGKLTTLEGLPLPGIADGAFVELVIPSWAVSDDSDRRKLQSKRIIEMLPAQESVWLGLSRNAVNAKRRANFPDATGGAAAGYLVAEVILLEPLFVSVDGSERTKLNACRCDIRQMSLEAKSLNHAYTLLPEEFETNRMSHTGNVFRRGFVHQNKRWLSLDELRLVLVARALQGVSESVDKRAHYPRGSV
jgi:hypothetical protein